MNARKNPGRAEVTSNQRRSNRSAHVAAHHSDRAEVPFKSARATHPSGPTGLADGLELKGAPTRIGESTPRRRRKRTRWFPRSRARCAGLGYTFANIKSGATKNQGRLCGAARNAIQRRHLRSRTIGKWNNVPARRVVVVTVSFVPPGARITLEGLW